MAVMELFCQPGMDGIDRNFAAAPNQNGWQIAGGDHAFYRTHRYIAELVRGFSLTEQEREIRHLVILGFCH